MNPARHPAPGAAKGTLFVISAPSGAGKTSLVRALTERDPTLEVSVSHTTRPRRSGEHHGVNYHFVDLSIFQAMLAEDAFLEHARVFGNLYGTSAAWVQGRLDAGADVILEIDWQGAAQIRRRMTETVSIFVLPPSRAALESRLRRRAQDDDATIRRRLGEACTEMSHYREFDYVVVNDDFDTAVGDLLAIVRAQRLHRARQTRRLGPLVAELLSGSDHIA